MDATARKRNQVGERWPISHEGFGRNASRTDLACKSFQFEDIQIVMMQIGGWKAFGNGA